MLATSLVGLALGAAAGALLGALLGMRVPQTDVATPDTPPREGRVLVTVHPTDVVTSESRPEAMQAGGGYDVRVYDAPVGSTPVQPSMVAETPDISWTDEPLPPEEAPPDSGAVAEAGEAAASDTVSDTVLGMGAEGGYGDGEAREWCNRISGCCS